MSIISKLKVWIGADTDDLDKKLKKGKKQVSSFGSEMKKLGTNVVGILAIGAAFRDAFKTIVDFEKANANLAAVLGTTKNKISDLTEDAKKLGATTSYTASQVTLLQTELSKLGFNKNEILQSTQYVLQFAGATGAELPEAAKLAGAALRTFGFDASQMQRVVSTLGVATTKSALDFEYLNTAFSTVAPVAKTFGFTIEETTALLGVLADSGFDASSAATATRNILLNMADDSAKLAKALGQPIKSLDELVPALIKLRDSGIDLAGTLSLTDKRSVAAFNTFLQGAEKTLTLRDAITDAGSALKAMSDEKLDSVQGSVNIMQSAFEGLILRFYESRGIFKILIDSITKLIDATSFVIGKFSEFRKVTIPLTATLLTYLTTLKLTALWKKNNANRSVLMAAAEKAYGIVVNVVTGKIKLATIAQKALNIAWKANPVGLVITAITALISVITVFVSKTSAAKKVTKELNEAHKELENSLFAEKAQMVYLFEALKKTNAQTETRKTIIKLLNEKYGQYLTNLLSEKSTLEDIERAQKQANDELVRSLVLKSRSTAIETTTKAYMDTYEARYNEFIKRITRGKSKEQKKIIESQINEILSWLNSSKIQYNPDTKVIKATQEEYNKLSASIAIYEKQFGQSNTDTRAWILELLGIMQKMNTELDNQNQYYDNQLKRWGVSLKMSANAVKAQQKTLQEVSVMSEKDTEAIGDKIAAYESLLNSVNKVDLANKDLYEKEIARLEELKKKRETSEMGEETIALIKKKKEAYEKLAEAVKLDDTVSQDYYNKEIARLNTLIKKTDELSQKRILAAKKRVDGGAVELPVQVYGIKEAAGEFEAISQTLFSNLLGSAEKMKPIGSVFDKVRDTIEKINKNGFNSQNLADLGTSIESITGNTIDLQHALSSLDAGVQVVGQLRAAYKGLKEAGRFDEAKVVKDFIRVVQGLVTGTQVAQAALAELKNALQEVVIGFGESMGKLIAGTGDLKKFGILVAETFGNMAINVGKTAIATGVAVAGIKTALKSLNPYAAIAAGVALVALGTAVKASLGKIADGGTAPTFSSHVLSGSGVTDTRTTTGIDNAAKPVEVIVRGDFKLRGSTLVAAVESENARKKITT